MPGTVPVVELILANAADALRGIKASEGYGTTVRDVTRFQINPFDANRLPAIAVYDVTDEAVDLSNRPVGFESRMVQIVCECWLRETKSNGLSTDLSLMWTDVYTALMADPFRGGWALDTSLGNIAKGLMEPGVPIGSVEVTFFVQYRFPINDPFSG